jgi:hypothetical protein
METKIGQSEILALLGAGGMGEVYQARDIRLNREVAINVLPGEVAHDAERLRRFEQEARATSELNHPIWSPDGSRIVWGARRGGRATFLDRHAGGRAIAGQRDFELDGRAEEMTRKRPATTMKYFNTTGAIQPDIHYCIPPLERLNLKEVLGLIAERKYFVLHAPRQTGKTSCLLALRDLLNQEGQYACVYCNVEGAQSAREDVEGALNAIVGEVASQAQLTLGENYLLEQLPAVRAEAREHGVLKRLLTLWAQHSPKPLVLLIDEIDTLIGDSLIAVLRQIRSGYHQRPQAYPHSIILCGLRDVRDYRIHSAATKEIITGGSAFNIKAESLRLGDFTPADVERLYRQHTAETGQIFEDEIFPLVWELVSRQRFVASAELDDGWKISALQPQRVALSLRSENQHADAVRHGRSQTQQQRSRLFV